VKQFAIYTAARLVLFLVSYGAIVGAYLLISGADTIPLLWPFLAAVVVSAIASVFLLRKQREDFARAVHGRAERSMARRTMVEAEEARARDEQRER